ncbi:MAG: NAD(P)-binding domain-containing protein [Planctomycetes bacterium]|nr:NAD(P)-binding domain-containing protein [Planctomycetota bacterium]
MSTPEPPPGAGSPRAEGSHAGLPRVAVIGAGLMGHGIAQEFMAAGAPTSLWDPSPEVLDAVPARIREHLSRIGSEAEVTLTLAADLAQAVDGADLIVEAIPENMELKRELLSTVQPLAPEAVFASNTSVLRITEIAQNAQRPELVVGTHWWNPPYLIPLVEVVGGESTDIGDGPGQAARGRGRAAHRRRKADGEYGRELGSRSGMAPRRAGLLSAAPGETGSR